MISVEEAKRLMMECMQPMPNVVDDPRGCYGFRLAQDVAAPFDHPLFDMSAVDGYAFAHGAGHAGWKVVSNIAAGEACHDVLHPGECVRIFTGAMLPMGADTVVMQEQVQRTGDVVTHSDDGLRAGSNVRVRGEQVRAGDLLLKAGTHLGPAAIGLLTSVGVRKVSVYDRPMVRVLRTGGEFVDGSIIPPGRIFSSNDVMLRSALFEDAIHAEPDTVKDDRRALTKALSQASSFDAFITTGGVSVGDHDLVRTCLEDLGATIHFHGVAQKPGKPMLFATLDDVPVFGLPGNPRAVLVLYYEYVRPFLRAMQGSQEPFLHEANLPIAAPLQVKGERAEFRAALVRNGSVELLPDEGSHMLRTLTQANALAYLPADRRTWGVGDPIAVHYLPQHEG